MLQTFGRFVRPALFIVLALLVAGCARPGGNTRDHLTIVQTQDFPSLDPIFVSGVGGQELAALLYSYLVKFDDRGELIPDAAIEVPTRANGGISPDGLQIVYHLRPGIRFSDGSSLTSFDVAETIGHVAFPGSDAPSRVAFDDIAAISTPDAMTVKIFLRTPYAPIVLYLCGPGNAVPILSGRQLAGHAHMRGTILDSAPIGSGPYRVDRWLRGERVELRANPYYFGGTPKIERITILPVPSSVTAYQMLRTGEANAYVNADDSQFAELSALPGERTESVPIDGTGALIFNTTQPALADARVRRALTQGLDIAADRQQNAAWAAIARAIRGVGYLNGPTIRAPTRCRRTTWAPPHARSMRPAGEWVRTECGTKAGRVLRSTSSSAPINQVHLKWRR